jgi:hypothetical protein
MRDLVQEFEDSLILAGYSPEMAEQIARKMFEDHKQEGK